MVFKVVRLNKASQSKLLSPSQMFLSRHRLAKLGALRDDCDLQNTKLIYVVFFIKACFYLQLYPYV